MYLLGADASSQRRHNGPEPDVGGFQGVGADIGAQFPVGVFPEQRPLAELQRAHRLLQGGLEGAVDGHHLAGGFHLSTQNPVAGGKLIKRPAGNLNHYVVQSRLEGSQRLLGNGVGDFIQPLADGYLGGHPGNGVAGGLAGQG